MAVSIGSLILDLRASTDGLSKDAAKAVQKARRMGNDMAKAIAVGAAGATAALGVVIEQASARIDKLAKASDKLGVPIEKLRALQELGDKSGVGIEATTGAIKNLQNQVFLAAAGSEKAAYGFRALGLDVSALLKLSPDQQLTKVADALNGVQNQTVKAGIATKLFGDAGADMLAVFRGGSKDLADAEAKLTALGVAVNRVDAAKIEIANDAISDLKLIAEGAGNQLAVVFAPIIAGVAKKISELAGETNGFRTWIERLVDVGVSGIGLLANAFRGWQVIIAGGKIAWFELAKSMDFALQAAGVLLTGTGVLLEQSMKGWKELGLVIQLAMITAANEAKPAIQFFLDGTNRQINAIIKGINSITGKNIPEIKLNIDSVDFQGAINGINKELDDLIKKPLGMKDTFNAALKDFTDFTTKLEAGTDIYSASAQKAWSELDALLSRELPSEALNKWLADVRAKTAEAANAIATSVKPVFEGINVEPLKKVQEHLKHIHNAIFDDVFNPWEQGYKAIQDNIAGLVRGTVSWKDALVDVSQTFVTTVIQSMVQMAAQWLATQTATMFGVAAIQKTTQAAGTASSLASAAAMEAAWIPAAIAASIATYGAAAWAGLGSFVAATALGTAAAVGIGAIGSLATTALTGKNLQTAGSRAGGGHVNAGSLYRVNENGTEMFRPDVSGEVVPMGQFEKEQDSSSAGMMFNISYSFASGLQRADLAPILAQAERKTISTITDLVSRGGAFRKQMQR